MQCSKNWLLLDHLVGALLEQRWNVEAERLGGFLEGAQLTPTSCPARASLKP
jgi:hypothetical protein